MAKRKEKTESPAPEVEILEFEHRKDDVWYLKIKYLSEEYQDIISVSGLELALVSAPENKKAPLLAFKTALDQLQNAPAKPMIDFIDEETTKSDDEDLSNGE